MIVIHCDICNKPCTDSPYVNILCLLIRGQGGTIQIMENEFECLVVRGDHGGHFAEKFVKRYCS